MAHAHLLSTWLNANGKPAAPVCCSRSSHRPKTPTSPKLSFSHNKAKGFKRFPIRFPKTTFYFKVPEVPLKPMLQALSALRIALPLQNRAGALLYRMRIGGKDVERKKGKFQNKLSCPALDSANPQGPAQCKRVCDLLQKNKVLQKGLNVGNVKRGKGKNSCRCSSRVMPLSFVPQRSAFALPALVLMCT